MPLVRVVTVDLAFALALLMDSAWLWATGVLAGVPARLLRLFAVATLGAALDVLSLFPAGQWLAWGSVRALGTVALVALAFARPRQWRLLPRVVLTYLGLGAAMGGATLLLYGAGPAVALPAGSGHLVAFRPVVSAGYPVIWTGGLLAIGGLRLLVTGLGAWWRLRSGLVEVVVDCGWGSRRLMGLVDSGNLLRDPLSGLPVLVVGQAALAGVVPSGLLALAREGPAEAGLPETAAGEPWTQRCRWVPFHAVGTPGGLLPALRPAALTVAGRPVQALVAFGPSDLGGGGAYQALVPQWLVGGAVPGVCHGGQGG